MFTLNSMFIFHISYMITIVLAPNHVHMAMEDTLLYTV